MLDFSPSGTKSPNALCPINCFGQGVFVCSAGCLFVFITASRSKLIHSESDGLSKTSKAFIPGPEPHFFISFIILAYAKILNENLRCFQVILVQGLKTGKRQKEH